MGYNIRLDVTIVVLAGPDECAIGFQRLSDHVVDEAMFVPDTRFLVCLLVFPVSRGKLAA